MVAVGLGGRLIRTVSFLGCTFAASAGFGGTDPLGGFGMFSAIIYLREPKLGLPINSVKCLFDCCAVLGAGQNSSQQAIRAFFCGHYM